MNFSSKIYINIQFTQIPTGGGNWTMSQPRLDRPPADMANAMIHEGNHVTYRLRDIINNGGHNTFNRTGDECFMHVEHPVLVPPSSGYTWTLQLW